MADYNSNIIKPVESLQNITSLSPARRREEKKHRQQLNRQNKEKDESAKGEEALPEEQTKNKSVPNPDSTGIDYCA